jgi:hypothetical protein
MEDGMRLYQGCSATTARHVVDHGFLGELWMPLKEDQKGGITRDQTGKPVIEGEVPERWCVFRSGSFGAGTGQEEESPLIVIPEGDFVLMIEVPEDVAKKYEVVERSEIGTDGHEEMPPVDREFWLTEEVANRFRDTMKVYDRDGAEVPPDLVGK